MPCWSDRRSPRWFSASCLRWFSITPRAAPTSSNRVPESKLRATHPTGVCKSKCCPNTTHRKIARSIHEGARDVARKIAKTDAFKQSGSQRKKVEMLFAHLKRILKLDRLRLRGLAGAQDEFILAATAQNLRRMAKWLMPESRKARSIAA